MKRPFDPDSHNHVRSRESEKRQRVVEEQSPLVDLFIVDDAMAGLTTVFADKDFKVMLMRTYLNAADHVRLSQCCRALYHSWMDPVTVATTGLPWSPQDAITRAEQIVDRVLWCPSKSAMRIVLLGLAPTLTPTPRVDENEDSTDLLEQYKLLAIMGGHFDLVQHLAEQVKLQPAHLIGRWYPKHLQIREIVDMIETPEQMRMAIECGPTFFDSHGSYWLVLLVLELGRFDLVAVIVKTFKAKVDDGSWNIYLDKKPCYSRNEIDDSFFHGILIACSNRGVLEEAMAALDTFSASFKVDWIEVARMILYDVPKNYANIIAKVLERAPEMKQKPRLNPMTLFFPSKRYADEEEDEEEEGPIAYHLDWPSRLSPNRDRRLKSLELLISLSTEEELRQVDLLKLALKMSGGCDMKILCEVLALENRFPSLTFSHKHNLSRFLETYVRKNYIETLGHPISVAFIELLLETQQQWTEPLDLDAIVKFLSRTVMVVTGYAVYKVDALIKIALHVWEALGIEPGPVAVHILRRAFAHTIHPMQERILGAIVVHLKGKDPTFTFPIH